MDDASHLDAYFWDSSRRIRVRYLTSGCVGATNGGAITFSLRQSDVVSVLEQATSDEGRGTIRGTILQFGGPVATDGTQPIPRPVMAIVALYTRSTGQSMASGSPVREIRAAADGTFSFAVASGTYFVVADALDGTQIAEPQRVSLLPGGTSKVSLRADVP